MDEAEEEAKVQRKAVVLTAPLALEGGLAAEHRPPNLLKQVLSLFRNVRPGSDLTRFQACLLISKQLPFLYLGCDDK